MMKRVIPLLAVALLQSFLLSLTWADDATENPVLGWWEENVKKGKGRATPAGHRAPKGSSEASTAAWRGGGTLGASTDPRWSMVASLSRSELRARPARQLCLPSGPAGRRATVGKIPSGAQQAGRH